MKPRKYQPTNKSFTEQDAMVLKELHAAGRTRAEMARRFKCSVNTIAHQLKKVLHSPEPILSKAEFVTKNFDEIWLLHREHNLAAKDIAVRLGFTTHYVWIQEILKGELPLSRFKTQTMESLINTSVIGISWDNYQRVAGLIRDEMWSQYYHLWVNPKVKRQWDARGIRGHVLVHLFSMYDGFFDYDAENDAEYVRSKPLPFHLLCHPANLDLTRASTPGQAQPDSSYSWPEVKDFIRDFEEKNGIVFTMLKGTIQ